MAATRDAVVEGRYDVVFGGGDDTVAALATYRDRIPAVIAHPAVEIVMAALDKTELARRGEAAGFAVPRTELVTDAVRRLWDGPVIVKCRSHWQPGQRHEQRIEARRYPDARRAADRIEHIVDAGLEPVFQEVIDGDLGALVGLVRDGRFVGRVQQRTTRVWPTPNGSSARAETVVVDETLAARAEALLADLGWEGLVELQFVLSRDGTAHLIDLNGRFYGSMALADAAGARLADAWARQAIGEPAVPLVDARPGVRFSWTAGDLRRAFAERHGGLAADVTSTLRWARRADASSVWDGGDVRPALSMLSAAAATSAKERLRRLRPGHGSSASWSLALGLDDAQLLLAWLA